MKNPPTMLIEHGLIPGKTLCPDQPGMENSSSVIPDTQKMNPNCVCTTRTCPLHGFCQYCVAHHEELNRTMTALGTPEHCHFHHCKQELLTERLGPERTLEMAQKIAAEQLAAAEANRAAEKGDA